MPPRRNHRQKNNKPPIAGAMADCVLPKDTLVCILTRLPVKSIHRFKSVCKPWCKLFATPKFMKTHHAQLSENPENQSAIIYSLTAAHYHTMSFVKLDSSETKPINLDHPYPEMLYGMDFVGCCYGLLCLSYPPFGQWIILWNPATKLFKRVPLPNLEFGDSGMVSLGFGWDDQGDDFKVVRIVPFEKKTKKNTAKKLSVGGVEVYSANSDSWKTIKLGFQFSVFWTKNDAIVNGNPYWFAKVDGNVVLVSFDTTKMVFKVVPLPLSLNLDLGLVLLLDWRGDLAALMCKENDERAVLLDVWVFDDVGKIWSKNLTFGPIELKVDRFLQCLKNGEVLGECRDGELFVFDPANGVVKKIAIDGSEKRSFQIYGYTESLAHVKGMQKKKVQTEEEKKEEDKKIDEMVDSFCRSYLVNY